MLKEKDDRIITLEEENARLKDEVNKKNTEIELLKKKSNIEVYIFLFLSLVTPIINL